jgi:hypothetical protein
MDEGKQARIERYRARIAEANPAGVSSRRQPWIRIGESLIEQDEPKLLTTIDYSSGWKSVFGASRRTVYRAKDFSTGYDPP